MVTDLKKAVNSIINERLNSPVIGAFMLSWMVFNWKVIVFLIFETQKEFKGDKIAYIELHYLTDPWLYFGIPFIFAITYPFISLAAYYFTEWINLRKAKIEFKLQEKTPVDSTKMMEIYKSINKKDSEYDELLNKKEEEIKINNQQYLDGRKILLGERHKLNDDLVKLKDFHEIQIDEGINENKKLDQKINELQKENSKLMAVFTPLEQQLSNHKEEFDKHKLAESSLKKEIKKLNDLVKNIERDLNMANKKLSLENKKTEKRENELESYVDAVLNDSDVLSVLGTLKENSSNKYIEMIFHSPSSRNFLMDNGFLEISPTKNGKIRFSKKGEELFEKVEVVMKKRRTSKK